MSIFTYANGPTLALILNWLSELIFDILTADCRRQTAVKWASVGHFGGRWPAIGGHLTSLRPGGNTQYLAWVEAARVV